MSKAKTLKRKILKENEWIQTEFSYKKKKRIADDIRYLADMNPDFENLVFELGVSYLLTGKKTHFRIKEINERIENAYNKSCEGNWTATKDIKFLDTVDTFYIYQVALETILNNLKAL